MTPTTHHHNISKCKPNVKVHPHYTNTTLYNFKLNTTVYLSGFYRNRVPGNPIFPSPTVGRRVMNVITFVVYRSIKPRSHTDSVSVPDKLSPTYQCVN